MNSFLRHKAAQKQDIFTGREAKLLRNLAGWLYLRRVDAVGDQHCLPPIFFTEIITHAIAQYNDAVSMASSSLFTLHDIRRSEPAPFLTHMIQSMNRNYDLLAKQSG